MRAIDADDLILHLTICQQNGMPTNQFYAIDDVIHYVKTMPTVEPERKTGRWIAERREWKYTLRCSECGYTYTPRGLEDGTLDQADIHHYCPLCGTRMKEEGEG